MIIKRNGQEVAFDKSKIFNAISKANNSVDENHKITDIQIQSITDAIENDYNDRIKRNLPPLTVETIQDIVETKLAELSFVLSKSYMIYRYERALIRSNKATDDRALAIIRNKNDEINEENANKDALLLSTQRDYLAGEVNKGLSKRYIFPEYIYKLHEEGIIHLHDTDYLAMSMHNCSLIDLDDMLQNGTIISNTKIDKPRSFSTACNIATQIMAQVASSQFGGTMTAEVKLT